MKVQIHFFARAFLTLQVGSRELENTCERASSSRDGKAKLRLLAENPGLLAIFVGGSIAKGIERDDSDVDLIVVISDDNYRQRWAENSIAFLWYEVCDYQGGYVEGRFISYSYVKEAAERGSEPTRHSFTGVYPVYSTDSSLTNLITLIALYPEAQQKEKIASFLAQMQLNRWFFWGEGQRRGDKYLVARAAAEIVLFGCRLILAHNRILFACQKRLIEQTLAAPIKPDDLKNKIDHLLTDMTDEAKEDFCKAVESLTDWGKSDHLSRFLQDVEMSWFNRVPAISEW